MLLHDTVGQWPLTSRNFGTSDLQSALSYCDGLDYSLLSIFDSIEHYGRNTNHDYNYYFHSNKLDKVNKMKDFDERLVIIYINSDELTERFG